MIRMNFQQWIHKMFDHVLSHVNAKVYNVHIMVLYISRIFVVILNLISLLHYAYFMSMAFFTNLFSLKFEMNNITFSVLAEKQQKKWKYNALFNIVVSHLTVPYTDK